MIIIIYFMQKSQSIKNYNNTYSLNGVMEYLNQQIKLLTDKEAQWENQRKNLQKKISQLESQLQKQKNINNELQKKMKHRRTSSQEQTFIFNQTNISSYYPIVMMPKGSWSCKQNLKNHLDSVRALAWQNDYLVSSGEDCLLKIWQNGNLINNIRQHMGPVYTITKNKHYLFTGGSQGVIRKWDAKNIANIDNCIEQSEVHKDVIWELNHHPTQDYLISSSSDGLIQLFKTDHKLNIRTKFTRKSLNSNQFDIPTSIDWLSNQSIISGYVDLNGMISYDINTQKPINHYKYTSTEKLSQVNKVLYNEFNKTIISAHQDKYIRFFQPNSNKLIKSLVAHADSVTSITFQNNSYEFSSCSHDGNMRSWDIRKFKCLSDIPIHKKKYDQSANIILQHPTQSIIAVGGADGVIKILYETQ